MDIFRAAKICIPANLSNYAQKNHIIFGKTIKRPTEWISLL